MKSVAGEFNGMQLLSMMYVGFKQIDPTVDIGTDLSQEYEMAQRIAGK